MRTSHDLARGGPEGDKACPRLIAERTGNGHWEAFIESDPEVSTAESNPRAAIFRLCRFLHLEPMRFVESERTADRVVYRERTRDELREQIDACLPLEGPCLECGGSGQYVGLSVVEPCGTCGGSGEL